MLQAHDQQPHYPDVCAGGGRVLERGGAVAYTGFQAVDLRWGDPVQLGLTLWVVDHRYDEVPCACGHRMRAEAGQGVVDSRLTGIERSEWRRVGPGLVALIVALAWRFRRSRARIREFLVEWLGLSWSIGTIHQTIHEARAAVAPAEAEWIQAVLDRDRLQADETSWPEPGQPLLWRWVFVAATVTLYDVAGRGKERVENVLTGFRGGLISEGWPAYRDSERRWRCWTHRRRKAQGLAESGDREARVFGRLVLNTLEALMAAVYAACEGPPPVDRPTPHAPLLTEWRAACERHPYSAHQKTHALAVEFLNDGAAIFPVLSHPERPLTNHEAERALCDMG